MKILISGGHLTPALAFIDYIKENNSEDEIVFIGREFNKSDKSQQSREKLETEKRNIKFISFNSPKLSSNSWINKILVIPSLVFAILKCLYILLENRPNVFVSFGGYLAIPVAIAAWVMRIPVITHEQTRTIGVANQVIAKFANYLALSYKDSLEYINFKNTIITGNLIRKNIFQNKVTKPEWITKQDKPMIYITGGSQGSEIINNTVAQIIKPLTKDFFVIHQCGGKTKNRDYLAELENQKKTLSIKAQDYYVIKEWITEDELAYILKNAILCVSRAGANTTEELALANMPTILIPLPFSHNDEQLLNAKALSEQNMAILLEQKNLTPEILLEQIQKMAKFNKKYRRNLSQVFSSINADAEAKLYKLVKSTQSS